MIAGAAFISSCDKKTNKNGNLLHLASSLGSAQNYYPGAAGTLKFMHFTNDMECYAEKTLGVKVDSTGKMTIDSGSLEYTLDYVAYDVRFVEHYNLNFAPTGQYNRSIRAYDVIENTSVKKRTEYYVRDDNGQWVKYFEDTKNTTWNGGLHFENMIDMDEYRIAVESTYVTIIWDLKLQIGL